MSPDDIPARVTALESEVAQMRSEIRGAGADAAAARYLASAADRDVTTVREELRAHTSVINAFREDHVEFKAEMYGFRAEMYGFRDEMYGFRDEMYAFRDQTRRNFEQVSRNFEQVDRNFEQVQRQLGTVRAGIEQIVGLLQPPDDRSE